MTETTTHTTGAFCWADLTTPDHPGSKAFYTTLFGWEGTDNDLGEGMVYSSMALHGRPAVGIANRTDGSDEPAAWSVYVKVDSADAAVERARSLGAEVEGEGAFDVFELGRMASLTDTAGARFRIWEPRLHTGAEVMGEHGALAWFELSSADTDTVVPFYSQLFDWTVAGAPAMEEYLFATTAAGEGTGAIQASDGRLSGWMPYFGSADVDASVATATEHGADTLVPAMDIPGGMGRFAILRDPQGAVFGLYRGGEAGQ